MDTQLSVQIVGFGPSAHLKLFKNQGHLRLDLRTPENLNKTVREIFLCWLTSSYGKQRRRRKLHKILKYCFELFPRLFLGITVRDLMSLEDLWK